MASLYYISQSEYIILYVGNLRNIIYARYSNCGKFLKHIIRILC